MIHLVTSLEQALEHQGEYRAGGSDVQARRRYRVSSGPVVDISRVPDLDMISWKGDRVTLGAHLKLARLAGDEKLIEKYPGFAMAAGSLATPQIRNVASLGGSLLQRTRCPYYRHPDTSCHKKGGDGCPAREGDHRYGVCFDRGPCVHPHPSTLGMVLLAYEAKVFLHGQDEGRTMEMLYGDGSDPTRDHLLEPRELLTSVVLDSCWPGEHASYFRAISRARAEWPLVEVLVRLQIEDNEIRQARVALGGVANVPFRAEAVEEALVGKKAGEETFSAASKLASQGAEPLPGTTYKVELTENAVLETLNRAHQRIWGGEG